MRDRRQSERLPSILEGRIVLEAQAPKLQCTLRDISATGARIWLPAIVALPGEFQLEIPVLDQSMPTRLMWSKGKTHGVMFLEPLHALSDEKPDPVSDELPPSEPPSGLEGIPKGLAALTDNVLNDARQHLAEILEVPVEKVRLKLEIDP